MDLTEIGMSTKNWVDSAHDKDYWRASVSGNEPQASVSHGVYQLKLQERDGDYWKALVNAALNPRSYKPWKQLVS